jgi:ribonuclease-3
VLGLAVAHMLHDAFPGESEGELSRRLAALVRKETCAEVAEEWDVGPHMRLGEGEAQTGGRQKRALLGDVCEAIIGAVFLDGGAAAAERVVRKAFRGRMAAGGRDLRDAKTRLQEWAQARGLATPRYLVAARSGPDHAPSFEVVVEVKGFDVTRGAGASKRSAEQAAAAAFLAREAADAGKDRM